MELETTTRRSRRAILAAAAAGAAGMAASALVVPGRVAAAAGDPVGIEQNNHTTALTTITQDTADTGALRNVGNGSGTGVEGDSTSGSGVLGTSDTGDGVLGIATGAHRAGVAGLRGTGAGSAHADPTLDLDAGVYGWGNSTGVFGESVGGVGVYGKGLSGTGVWGAGDTAVMGDGQTLGGWFDGGVGAVGFGDPATYGLGLWGHVGTTSPFADIPTNIALLGSISAAGHFGLVAQGKVSLPDRGRRAQIAKHRSSVSITVPGVTKSNVAVASLNVQRPGRWVTAVVCSANKVTIYLNAKVTTATPVSWIVLD